MIWLYYGVLAYLLFVFWLIWAGWTKYDKPGFERDFLLGFRVFIFIAAPTVLTCAGLMIWSAWNIYQGRQ